VGYDRAEILLTAAWALVLAYFVCRAAQLRRVYSRRKYLAWGALKFLALACLFPPAWGLRVSLPATRTTTVFLVDRSLSVQEKAREIEAFLNRQVRENRGRWDQVAVVSFAREPAVEHPVSRTLGEVRLEAVVDPNFTDIQKALEFCRDYFPRGGNRRLVLITDGRENLGNSEPVLRRLGEEAINLVVLPVSDTESGDVQLVSLRGPAGAYPGTRITLEAQLYADDERVGVFRLLSQGRKVREENVAVKPGYNSLSFSVPAEGEAEAVFWGEISFAGDANPRNDSFTVSVPLLGAPAALVIGEKEDATNVARLVQSLGYTVVERRPQEAPTEPGGLSSYDLVVLANVEHRDLPGGFETALQKSVEDQGSGLLVVGGKHAFGPGGYEGTVLERLLPVSCRMKGREKVPDTGLVLVVDCSGSMNDESQGTRKIEMVKEAVLKSVEVLDQGDRLGVLAFSDRQEWVVPLAPLSSRETVRDRVGRLAPGGGTLILPALELAVEALEQADVKVKHLILLTDGQAEKEGYETILRRMKSGGITLSAVAVGRDADRELIRRLAEGGGGRSYYTDYLGEVPGIFVKEAYAAVKRYLNDREFIPRPPGTAGEPPALPRLYGYTGTGLKEGAEAILVSDTGDPVLARWQYGLGRVAAWTPDLSGQWSRDWIRWSGLQGFFSRVLGDLTAADGEGLDISLIQRGCRVKASVSASSFQAGEALQLLVLPPSAEENKRLLELEPVGKGAWVGEFDLEQTGSYALDFRLVRSGSILKQARRTVYLDYSPEFDALREQDIFLPAAYGRVVDWNANVFALPLERKTGAEVPMEPILAALALAALLGELWARKML
jgi:Mg-chelatase subunit ChlD